MTGPTLKPARLAAADILRTGAVGLRARRAPPGRPGPGAPPPRRARALPSPLATPTGIPPLVPGVGPSPPSRAALMAQSDRLGTNLLTAEAGKDALGQDVKLPKNAVAM